MNLHARYTSLSDSDGDVLARVTLIEASSDLSVQASYYQLLEGKRNLAIDFDPYCSSLGELHPFWHARLVLHKGFGQHLMAEAGFEFRRLKEANDESMFNHEFKRYFGTLSLLDLPVENLNLSLNAVRWDTGSEQGDCWTLGGDAGYRIGKKASVSLGTDYSLYKYDYGAEEERDDVRTYYAKVKFRPLDMLMLGLSYNLEDDDFERYQAIKGELRVTF